MELKSSGGGTIVMGVVESISMMRTQVLHITSTCCDNLAVDLEAKRSARLRRSSYTLCVLDTGEKQWRKQLAKHIEL